MMKTLWGYEIDSDGLPPMITSVAFDEFTAGRFSGDVRIGKELDAASSAIRNYVGWHLYPSADCVLAMNLQDRRVTRVGCDLLVQLPAKYVTEVEQVLIGTQEYEFTFEVNGILRIYDVSPAYCRRTVIAVSYTAGLTDELMGDVAELVAHRVSHSLVSSYGVTNETAGGVSITYNANWVNSSRATALPDDNKEVLAPFRLQGVF